MPRIIPAALALACVCSPAIAVVAAMIAVTGPASAHAISGTALAPEIRSVGLAASGLIVAGLASGLACGAARSGRIIAAALALIWGFSIGPVLAAEVAADNTSVTLSAAPWISLLQEIVITAVIPAVAAYAIQAIRRVYPWAALFLTQARVEQMANAVTEYAINAVPGAVKEGKLSIRIGSAVIAKAVQRAVDAAPAKALEAAGGQAGLAEIVFRKLNLEDDANEHNTLAPVVAQLPRAGQ